MFFPGMEGCGGCGYCASLAARHHNQVNFHQNQSIPVQNMVKARYRRQAAAVGDGGGDGLDAVVDGHFSCGRGRGSWLVVLAGCCALRASPSGSTQRGTAPRPLAPTFPATLRRHRRRPFAVNVRIPLDLQSPIACLQKPTV